MSCCGGAFAGGRPKPTAIEAALQQVIMRAYFKLHFGEPLSLPRFHEDAGCSRAEVGDLLVRKIADQNILDHRQPIPDYIQQLFGHLECMPFSVSGGDMKRTRKLQERLKISDPVIVLRLPDAINNDDILTTINWALSHLTVEDIHRNDSSVRAIQDAFRQAYALRAPKLADGGEYSESFWFELSDEWIVDAVRGLNIREAKIVDEKISFDSWSRGMRSVYVQLMK